MISNKKVIESAVVAIALITATTVTAFAPTRYNGEDKANATTVEANGVAGVIEELASTHDATEINLANLTATVEKTDTVTVAEAAQTPEVSIDTHQTAAEDTVAQDTAEQDTTETEAVAEEPQLTEEEQAWSNRLMANVEDFLYVRSAPDENADNIVGKLLKTSVADIVEQAEGWTHITSGNVDGYVKNDYCVMGVDALARANAVCSTVATINTDGLRVRVAPSEDSEIYTTAATGTTYTVNTAAAPVEGWVSVCVDDVTAYVKGEYVTTELNTGVGKTSEEEAAEVAAKAAEEAAKAAAAKTTAIVTQNAAVAATADDTTILAAIIQCEAGNECYEGQVAVGAVVMNRVRSGAYPNSIYNVVYQSGQFTPAGNGSVAAACNSISSSCLQAAQAALAGTDNTGGATCFRNVSSGYQGVVIGNHVFW